MTFADVAANCDVFTIGGTKNGALFGEAIVINEPAIADDFEYIMKQRGALLAKGRLLGIQYECLFADGLYMRAAKHACHAAARIAAALRARGIEFLFDSPTNQIFPMLDARQLNILGRAIQFMPMDPLPDGRRVIRIATSWATTEAAVNAALTAIENF